MTSDRASFEDRIAIQDMICAVSAYGDRREFDAMYGLFAADAVFDYASLLGTSGALSLDEFRANAAKFRPAIDTLHQVTNFAIRIDGDTAEALSTVRAVTCVDDLVAENGGLYTHRLRRTEAGWRITYVRYDVVFRQGPDVFARARAKMGAESAADE
ncbi:MAG: nuclear transport factor 2 family protein [Novosphingobium sp.]